MSIQVTQDKLTEKGYRGIFAIFSPLFPLVGMMWADGRNQHEEIEIFCRHATSYFNMLKSKVAVNELTLYDFTEKAVTDRDFARVCSDLAIEHPVFSVEDQNIHVQILNAAIDIAAAATVEEVKGETVRVTSNEKWWVKRLTLLLAGIEPDVERVERLAT